VPSDTVVIPLVPTGIGELSSENKIFLYPNPAQNSIRILFSDPYQGAVMLKILSAGGTVVKQMKTIKDREALLEELDLAGFESGLYVLELLTDQYTVRNTFIILK
jgi:hypothetical protein